ncbi:MAG: hypothetical protein Tsb0019_05780 [Roseibium sp.]
MKIVFKGTLLGLMLAGVLTSAADASVVTYTIDDYFGGHINASANGHSNPTLPHAKLSGTLSFDTALSDIDALVGYSLTSWLPNQNGGTSRTSSYSFGSGAVGIRFASKPDGAHFNLYGDSNSLLSLVIDTLSVGDEVLSFTASEKFLNCKTIYYGGPVNSCKAPNYGIGLGTGVQGQNTSAAMTGTNAASVTPVPLPAAGLLLLSAVGGGAVFSRRGRFRAA